MIKLEFFSWHINLILSNTFDSWIGYKTTSEFFLIIPAFSFEISSMVLPRYWQWSNPIAVNPTTKGFLIIFVASNLPPRPTSRITKSQFCLLKYSNATAVSKANSDTNASYFSVIFFTYDAISAKSELLIGTPLILIRSLKNFKNGDVNNPVL